MREEEEKRRKSRGNEEKRRTGYSTIPKLPSCVVLPAHDVDVT